MAETERSNRPDDILNPASLLAKDWEKVSGDPSGNTFRTHNGSSTVLKHQLGNGSFRYLRFKEKNMGWHVMDSHIIEGDFDGAIHLADSILEENPDDAETLWRKAECHMMLGEDEKAEEIYERLLVIYDRLIEQDPGNATYINNKGVALSNLGRKKEALEHYERAYALETHSAIITANLAGAYAEDGQYDKGLEYAEKALALDPDDECAQGTKAYCQWMTRQEPDETPEETAAYVM